MEKVNEDLLINYVENNLGQIITRDNTSGKICGYNIQSGNIIFGFKDSYCFGWDRLSSHDVVLVPYNYYRYFIEEKEIEHLILYGEIN